MVEKYIPVVVTYNRKEKLKKSINSLLNQSIQPQKIILVDNHSTDGTNILVKEQFEKEINGGVIEYHHLSENIGGSGGFYQGMKFAAQYETDYFALSDDDAFYRPDYFEKIFKIAKENSQIKAFQGFAYDDIQDTYNVQGSKIVNWNTLNSVGIKNENKDALADISTFVGFTFEASLVDQIGLPVDNFFIWNDDAEYSLRMHKLTKILQVKDAVIEHCGTQREAGALVPLWKTYYGFRNRFILRKRYSRNKFIAYLYTTFLLLRNSMSALIKSSYKSKRMAYIKGYFDAYFNALSNKLGKNTKYLPGKKY